MNGNDGNNTLNGGEGADTINGGAGNDTISGDSAVANAGNDILRGDAGDDVISDTFGSAADIDGGTGNDVVTINVSLTTGTVAGGADLDVLTVNSAVNLSQMTVSGFERLYTTNSIIITAKGEQFDAFDRIAVTAANLTGSVALTLAASAPVTGGAISLDLSDELSNGGDRGVTLTGSTDSETITVGNGVNTITAGNGNDVINGGASNDTMHGGLGNDTLNGNDGNDTLNGNEGNDRINGGIGNDIITGDSATIGAGNDILRGEDGNDTITDNFGTAVDIDGGIGDDTINITTTFASGTIAGGADIDVLSVTGAADLSKFNISTVERLYGSSILTAKADQFDAFDRIAQSAAALTAGVSLTLAASAPVLAARFPSICLMNSATAEIVGSRLPGRRILKQSRWVMASTLSRQVVATIFSTVAQIATR